MTVADPPADLAAERSVLGGAMLSAEALDGAIDLVSVEEFYRPAHQVIWATIIELYAAGEPTDPVAVSARLDRNGELTRIGGAPYLHTCISETPTAANIGYYAEIVARKAVQRRAVEVGTRITHIGYRWDGDDDPAALAARVEAEAATVAGRDRGAPEVCTIGAAVDEAMVRLTQPSPPALSTGLYDLDELLTGGLRNGAVYVVGARPGRGKSITAANIALNAAQQGVGVLFASLEMPRAEITDRVLANLSGVEHTAIMRHRLDGFDWQRLERAQERLRGLPLFIRDTASLTGAALRRLAEQHARRPPGLGLVVVDYVQRMTATDPRLPRHLQVGEHSRMIKTLAMNLHLPVLVLSKNNRESARRAMPDMDDLGESGDLESDADVVIILRLPAEPNGELEMHVVKNRHGQTGVVNVVWSPHYARIRSLLRSVS